MNSPYSDLIVPLIKLVFQGPPKAHTFLFKQGSKELSPRPLANAPKTFNSKKTLKLLMLKGSLSF